MRANRPNDETCRRKTNPGQDALQVKGCNRKLLIPIRRAARQGASTEKMRQILSYRFEYAITKSARQQLKEKRHRNTRFTKSLGTISLQVYRTFH